MKRETGTDAEISAGDRRLVELVGEHYRPAPMSPARRVLFRRRLDERLARGSHVPWKIAVGGLAVGAVTAALWLSLVRSNGPTIARVASTQVASTEEPAAPVLYAFVDPDAYGDTLGPRDFLPDDYMALARALDVPVNQ